MEMGIEPFVGFVGSVGDFRFRWVLGICVGIFVGIFVGIVGVYRGMVKVVTLDTCSEDSLFKTYRVEDGESTPPWSSHPLYPNGRPQVLVHVHFGFHFGFHFGGTPFLSRSHLGCLKLRFGTPKMGGWFPL